MYKGIAGSEGIGIGNVVIIEEHEIVIENKKITDTDVKSHVFREPLRNL